MLIDAVATAQFTERLRARVQIGHIARQVLHEFRELAHQRWDDDPDDGGDRGYGDQHDERDGEGPLDAVAHQPADGGVEADRDEQGHEGEHENVAHRPDGENGQQDDEGARCASHPPLENCAVLNSCHGTSV